MKTKYLSPTSYLLFIISIFLCCGILYRYHISNSIRYFFLIWNLLLAWIPYLIAIRVNQKKSFQMTDLIWIFIWCLFFPNAPYIITDFFHLTKKADIPLWYDTLIIYGFSFMGLFLGLSSMSEINTHLKKCFNNLFIDVITAIFCFVAAFGIYIGRYQRWNSWDILSSPLLLFKNIFDTIIDYPHNGILHFSVLFGGFLLVTYSLLKSLVAKQQNDENRV